MKMHPDKGGDDCSPSMAKQSKLDLNYSRLQERTREACRAGSNNVMLIYRDITIAFLCVCVCVMLHVCMQVKLDSYKLAVDIFKLIMCNRQVTQQVV